MFEEEFKLITLNQGDNLKVASRVVTNLDFIEYYKDYLDWNILSERKDLMVNLEFLERFKDRIIWVTTYFNASWDIFWKYRDYSFKSRDNHFWLIDHYIGLTKTKEEKYKILEDILQDSTEYDEEVTRILHFPSDISFIRDHEDRIIWNILHAVLDKDNLSLFLEFKDKIRWDQFEEMLYWMENIEIVSWVWDNVGDKIDWNNIFKRNNIKIPIPSLRIIKSAIKESVWNEYCHSVYYLRFTLEYLKDGITRPEHYGWGMVGKELVDAYRTNNSELINRFFTSEFIEKYEYYIPWKDLISFMSYGKNLIIKKVMPKKTRKRLGYHIWFGIIFKLEKKESTKP